MAGAQAAKYSSSSRATKRVRGQRVQLVASFVRLRFAHVLRKPARIGDAIRVVVKKARPDGRVSRKDILAAVVVRQKGIFRRPDGSTIRFQENAAVLLKRDRSGPVGTRVTGPVARELRQGKWMKIIMMASRVV